MGVFDKFNADAEYDEREPPFTENEIEDAVDLRKRVTPDSRLERRDHCPHIPICESQTDCIEAIAWYRRHQQIIESRLSNEESDGVWHQCYTANPERDDR